MKLKAKLDTLDGLADALKEFYTKDADGKFVLDTDAQAQPAPSDALQKALKTEREAREELQRKLATFDGIDPAAVRNLLSKLGDDEETKLIKEGKIDQVVAKRTEKLKSEFDKQLKAAQDALTSAQERGKKYTTRVLDNHIREAASKLGLHAAAVNDALFRGRTIFSLDDEGNAVQLQDGKVVAGKDGVKPFSPSEWLESMREEAPHWFPAAGSGGGAKGNLPSGGNGGKKQMLRSAFDALSPAEKAATMKAQTEITDG